VQLFKAEAVHCSIAFVVVQFSIGTYEHPQYRNNSYVRAWPLDSFVEVIGSSSCLLAIRYCRKYFRIYVFPNNLATV
jgi:hypothetical protein